MDEQWRKGLFAAGWDLRKAVELAIGIEERGTELYRGLAKKWQANASLRELFTRLAQEEVAHREEFLALFSSIATRTSDAVLDEACLKAIAHVSFFSEESGALKEIGNLASPGQVLDKVLKFERATLHYYLGLKDVMGANPTLDAMIAEERRHTVEVLRAMEDPTVRDQL
ncbi:MAG TPA: ferritin family protein [Anaeromyxobacteraceae bacterium]